MRGSRMGMLATMIALGHAVAAPFKEAFAQAHAGPPAPPEHSARRNKVRKGSQRASGAAGQQRAARKLRCARARASKRKA